MLTDKHIREGLSRAYIQAVAFRAGFNVAFDAFDYGIDGTFSEVKRVNEPNGTSRYRQSGFKIDFQAKASSSANRLSISDTSIEFALEAKSQRDLADPEGTKRILILLVLPDDPAQWLATDEDALVLRRCAWWLWLQGQAPTTNSDSVVVQIPRAQRFDVAALQAMMQRVRVGETP